LAVKARRLTFITLMAALANVLSVPPLSIQIPNGPTVHFTQLPILISAVLAGPLAGLVTGAIGGLYMSLIVAKIPFIIGGLAILGLATGIFSRKLRPLYAGALAWLVQAPYTAVTDYIWFTMSPLQRTPQAAWASVTPILAFLTIEVVSSSVLAEVIIRYLREMRIAQQILGN